MRKRLGIIMTVLALAATMLPHRASTEAFEPAAAATRRWLRKPIILSLSTALSSPPSNVKADTDVLGALRRALQSWSSTADVQFLETTSTNQTISASDAGDGVNLITISNANATVFGSSQSPGQTRVFYDSGGAIVEADIALNPNVGFSTDGTAGTYDLESTFAHEIGHLLGLEHSAVIGATMQPRQAKNGVYGLPATSQRTLSEDDVSAARALYGPRAGAASMTGRLTTNTSGRAAAIFGAGVFAEDVATGKIVASNISNEFGRYRLNVLPPGVYRVFAQALEGPVPAADISGSYVDLLVTAPAFRSFVLSSQTPSESLTVSANTATRLSLFIFANAPTLVPRLIGMNGELSTAPLPIEQGKTFTIYVAGENVDQVGPQGISLSSPAMHVVGDSLREADFGTAYPAISFEVAVDHLISAGDYTIRLRSSSGEIAYLPGALTVDRP